jgi:hypothetical protein
MARYLVIWSHPSRPEKGKNWHVQMTNEGVRSKALATQEILMAQADDVQFGNTTWRYKIIREEELYKYVQNVEDQKPYSAHGSR